MDTGELLDRINARLNALGLSERSACLKSGLKPDGIRTIRRGHPPTLGKLRALAEVLQVPLDYLLEVTPDLRLKNSPARSRAAATNADLPPPPPPGYVYVAQFPKTGAPEPARAENSRPVLVPDRLIRLQLKGEPEDFLVCRMAGSAMSPSLENEDILVIDRRDTDPIRPGIFIVSEASGPVPKQVAALPGSDPLRYRVSCENGRDEAYELAAEAAPIVGRVVWLARKL